MTDHRRQCRSLGLIAPGTEGCSRWGLRRARATSPSTQTAAAARAGSIAAIEPYDKATVSRITGVPGDLITRVVSLLWERAPSLVLTGRYPAGHQHGSRNVAAIALLNVVLQNPGKTLLREAPLPFPQLAPTRGNFKALADINAAMAAGERRTLLVHGANPVYSTPQFMSAAKNMKKVAFKAAFVRRSMRPQCTAIWCCRSCRRWRTSVRIWLPGRPMAANCRSSSP